MDLEYDVKAKNDFMIMGYTVEFPDGKKPFPAQFAVMNKVLQALKKEQNALLESPTGSGKTLALLSSAMAWQKKHADEILDNHRANIDAYVQRKLQREAVARAAANRGSPPPAATGDWIPARRHPEQNTYTFLDDATPKAELDAGLPTGVKAEGPRTQAFDDDDDDLVPISFSQLQRRRQHGDAASAPRVKTETHAVKDEHVGPRTLPASFAKHRFQQYEFNSPAAVASSAAPTRRHAHQPVFNFPQSTVVLDVKSETLVDLTSHTTLTNPIDLTTPASSIKPDPMDLTTPSSATKSEYIESPPEFNHSVPSTAPSTSTSAPSAARMKMDPEEEEPAPKKERIPQIYFCSRTHSQLAQVIQELKKCPFAARVKMTLLGAKKHYCVHPRVRDKDAGTLNDECADLLDARSCRFQNKVKSQNQLRLYAPHVWDIEDLVELGETHQECPYFFARAQQEVAEIVFCPYNYIVDPQIRSSCAINLAKSVVIFDEAHNIEDVCRDSASFELQYSQLEESIKAVANAIKASRGQGQKMNFAKLNHLIYGWKRWLDQVETTLKPAGYECNSRLWNGPDAVAVLSEYCKLTPDTIASYQSTFDSGFLFFQLLFDFMEYIVVITDENKEFDPSDETDDPNARKVKLGNTAKTTISGILSVADYLFRGNMKYANDYKLAAVKQRGFGRRSNEWEYKACVWCLHAGVAFADITSTSRSVILTSGTLSPMTSFAGELGTTFPITLEANHVINMQKQVWLGTIVQGPAMHRDFSATYANQQDLKYQDALGSLVFKCVNFFFSLNKMTLGLMFGPRSCQIVPGGLLVFLPSYRFMTLLQDRWASTGLLAQMKELKTVFVEPRGAGKDFDALLEEFKHAIHAARQPNAPKTGALFFAVFRGKVSEGIDFSNDNARAVIAVGIPFPNIKEQQIALKQTYQNERSVYDKACAPGRVWYEHQAFRALNQALGRCIRHRLDYGAILLVDSRYRAERYGNQLSKWTRGHCYEYEQCEEALESVTNFFTRVTLDPAYQVPLEAPKMSKGKDKATAATAAMKRSSAFKKAAASSGWKPKKPKTLYSFFPNANEGS
ncbi:Aste57867_18305 [Aphanomyces stellatus]|uniref:DNA 5'-3' helicase FANCJ n=1 Tax=Aphanomyces stellatus TaxID=120398 RepID=A0A485LBG4_9STRA|nr:hypothetical protein As57867_018243 [Aphanomyces stellatus]VFT95041.1 Aste57867_18305 [Aphanomyces stellatus]